jgi:DNA-binding transcriptional regulator YdaS (Cro superfamily)
MASCGALPDFLAMLENLAYGVRMNSTSVNLVPVGADALEKAILQAGGLTKFSAELGVAYQLVQGWRADGRKFATPAEYVLRVERVSGVSRHELRPDLYPAD